MSQLPLFTAPRIVPTLVVQAMEAEHTVRVRLVADVYHLYAANVHEVDRRTGRTRVVGTRMRCGLVQQHGATWFWPGVTVEDAHQKADPCSRCFRGVSL